MKSSDYRETLYKSYSDSFIGVKTFDPSTQWKVFGYTYAKATFPSTEAKVLDIGCGKGEWLLWMQNKGFENLTGVDVAAEELEHFKGNKIRTISQIGTGFLETCEEKFDLIHAKDLFEHLTKNEALEFLQLCRDCLNPGGEIWILTFNAQSPLSAATRYGDFTHELAVTPTSMSQVMIAAGLKVRSVHCYVPSASGTMGLLRRSVFYLLDQLGGLFLKLRHGGQKTPENIAARSILPDLFAIAGN